MPPKIKRVDEASDAQEGGSVQRESTPAPSQFLTSGDEDRDDPSRASYTEDGQETKADMARRDKEDDQNFPRSIEQEQEECSVEGFEMLLNPDMLRGYGSGGQAFGAPAFTIGKSDEAFLKVISSTTLSDINDWETWSKYMVSTAVSLGVSDRAFKSGVFACLRGRARQVCSDMLPMGVNCIRLSSADYLRALRKRIAPQVERPLLQREFKKLIQGKKENPKHYCLRKYQLYIQAYPATERSFTNFLEVTFRGLYNSRLREYMFLRLGEIRNQQELVHHIATGSLYVTRLAEAGNLRKEAQLGLDIRARPQVGSETFKSQDFGKEKDKIMAVAGKATDSEGPSSEPDSEDCVYNVDGRKKNSEDKRPGKATPENSTCWYCGHVGHWKNECRRRLKDLKVSNVQEISSSSELEDIEKLMQVNALDREKGRRLVRRLYGDKKGRRPTRANKTSTSSSGLVSQVDPVKSGYGPFLEKLDHITDRLERITSLQAEVANINVNAVKSQQIEGAISGENQSFLGMKPNVATSQTTSG